MKDLKSSTSPKMVVFLFNLLFFLTPLTFLPSTSELFEFNKMVLVYAATALIATAWAIRMVLNKKFIIKRTILDIPLVLFLISQIISTVFSIDFYTSIFGYYTRFNGGLLSTICYLILYWAFVSNFTKEYVVKLFKTMLASAVIVAIWGTLEHFGVSLSCVLLRGEFNAACWVQDVQTRVFATFGQPNWLAAYLLALAPLTWAFALKAKTKKQYWIYQGLNLLFFATLLFTKSRSGILGLIFANILFWENKINTLKGANFIMRPVLIFFALIARRIPRLPGISTGLNKSELQTARFYGKQLLIFHAIYLGLVLLIGTPWTPNLSQILNPQPQTKAEIVTQSGTVIELDGTESGTLRTIVWRGALELWKKYPLFGSGVETFAYSYYQVRPAVHNDTSEWDFLYNKAHNEFLNYAANSGSFGLLSYMSIIAVFMVFIFKKIFHDKKSSYFEISLLSGFSGLLVSNFFGFSTVATSLVFFLFPAMSYALMTEKPDQVKQASKQNMLFFGILLICAFLIFNIWKYWDADIQYAKAKRLLDTGQPEAALTSVDQAIYKNPYAAVYFDTKAHAYAMLAAESGDEEKSKQLASLAASTSEKTVSLSPRNTNLIKSRSNLFVDLSSIDQQYLRQSIQTLLPLLEYAPTDPSIYYRIGLNLATDGHEEEGIAFIQQAVELKPDYKRARMALAYIYQQQEKYDEARVQLQYILDHISPDDTTVKEMLQDLTF